MCIIHRFARIGGLLLLPLSFSLGGCGLVFVPVVRQFPKPIKAIKVVDAQTRQNIPDAKVAFEVWKFSNWTHRGPHLEYPAEFTYRPPSYRTLNGQRTPSGNFVFESCRTVGSIQWFFPWLSPLGWNLYRDHHAHIVVSAQGYHSIFFQYYPKYPPPPGWEATTDCGDARFTQDKVLWFFLRRQKQHTDDETPSSPEPPSLFSAD